MTGWSGVRLWDGGDVAQVSERLTAGADPCADTGHSFETMLHIAAERAVPAVVAAMAGAARDPDVLAGGLSPLWLAVYADRYDNACALVAAGADPWLPMMAGWSPGRLALAGPEPGLFGEPPPGVALTVAEREAVALADEIADLTEGVHYDGTGLLCVAGLDATDVIRRLGGTAMTEEQLLAHYGVEAEEDPEPGDEDDWRWLAEMNDLRLVGVSDVPGGCVVTQPWGYQPQTPVVARLLSAGTVAYGLYANPKSGNQGIVCRDGVIERSDLHPGGRPWDTDPAAEVLLGYLYRDRAPMYACAFAGLRPVDARCVTGPADHWVLLPDRDYWAR
ncbi:hypothetical protein QLQ12_43245 [Actinoplanes sp. NEAU-A12]|uniref:Ankyrin repeat domain-containing protein n=1 Tax=Actinoplanes sandaracinus TaxID=3045177 RepID=A0ABT6X091_9ACTN|nr:hypothetical protein [Actinoplanes sandaracinus]MDI6105420.1 hypothetical protein [Actinoplanes sandaracinus]